jgi:hypothetical protein
MMKTSVQPNPEPAGENASPPTRKRISMHEGVAVWCDCCSCHAEPYWLEVAEALGVDLGSDHEDDCEDPR